MHLARKTFKTLQESRAKQQQEEKGKGKKRSWRVILDRKNVSGESQRSSRTSSRSGKRSRSENSFGSDISDNSSLCDYSCGKENLLESCERQVMNCHLESPVSETSEKHLPSPRSSCCLATVERNTSVRPRRKMIKGRPNLANLPDIGTKTSVKRSNCNDDVVLTADVSSVDVSPVKKRRTETGSVTTLEDLAVGNGIITRRRLPKVLIYCTVNSRYLELGFLEFCKTQSIYLNQKYILIAFSGI